MTYSNNQRYTPPQRRSDKSRLQGNSYRLQASSCSNLSSQPWASQSGPNKPSWPSPPPTSQSSAKRQKSSWGPPTTPSPQPRRLLHPTVAHYGKAIQYEDVKLGQIVWLPQKQDIGSNEPILTHPDFVKRDGAFAHPCIIVGLPNSQGRVLCLQVTAFTSFEGGLLEKYADSRRDGRLHSQADQRKRWLLVDHVGGGALKAHDDTPTLSRVNGAAMREQSYVNTEKTFCIDWKLLATDGRDVRLDQRAVETIVQHHNKHYNQFVVGLRDWNPAFSMPGSHVPKPVW